ncbi:hypothetical protein Sste5344_006728 [Sporothrix stenoceras]
MHSSDTQPQTLRPPGCQHPNTFSPIGLTSSLNPARFPVFDASSQLGLGRAQMNHFQFGHVQFNQAQADPFAYAVDTGNGGSECYGQYNGQHNGQFGPGQYDGRCNSEYSTGPPFNAQPEAYTQVLGLTQANMGSAPPAVSLPMPSEP